MAATKSFAARGIALGDISNRILADGQIAGDLTIATTFGINAITFGVSRSDFGRSPIKLDRAERKKVMALAQLGKSTRF